MILLLDETAWTILLLDVIDCMAVSRVFAKLIFSSFTCMGNKNGISPLILDFKWVTSFLTLNESWALSRVILEICSEFLKLARRLAMWKLFCWNDFFTSLNAFLNFSEEFWKLVPSSIRSATQLHWNDTQRIFVFFTKSLHSKTKSCACFIDSSVYLPSINKKI